MDVNSPDLHSSVLTDAWLVISLCYIDSQLQTAVSLFSSDLGLRQPGRGALIRV